MPAGWEWLTSGGFWEGGLVGVLGGTFSGLLGVSPGGILVPGLALVLALDQHSAQAVSLAAQVLPTSLPGVMQYSRRGHGASWAWIAWVSVGFLGGSYVGALGAGGIGDVTLRWLFISYLLLLTAVVSLRGGGSKPHDDGPERVFGPAGLALLAGVGFAGGASSGLLGIGGGLAMTALLVGVLRLPQHQAQGISLAVGMLPLTLPAVWVYERDSAGIPWAVVAGVVLGLLVGTMVGSRFATGMDARRLRVWFVALMLCLSSYMAGKALGWW